MKGRKIIKIHRQDFVGISSDNNLAKLVRGLPTWEFKMHAQLTQIFISRNKEKQNFDCNEIRPRQQR